MAPIENRFELSSGCYFPAEGRNRINGWQVILAEKKMSLKKKYLKSKPLCKVTFRLPSEAGKNCKSVHLVGDFNSWNTQATPMKRLKDGSFTVTLDLVKECEYEFRYCMDQSEWENDWSADRYSPTPFGDCDNSVVMV